MYVPVNTAISECDVEQINGEKTYKSRFHLRFDSYTAQFLCPI